MVSFCMVVSFIIVLGKLSHGIGIDPPDRILCREHIRTDRMVLIDKIRHAFPDTFGKDIFFIEQQVCLEHMGYFLVKYRYIPLEYDLVLEKNDFCFYITRDGKLYRKKGQSYKRIKNWMELGRDNDDRTE